MAVPFCTRSLSAAASAGDKPILHVFGRFIATVANIDHYRRIDGEHDDESDDVCHLRVFLFILVFSRPQPIDDAKHDASINEYKSRENPQIHAPDHHVWSSENHTKSSASSMLHSSRIALCMRMLLKVF